MELVKFECDRSQSRGKQCLLTGLALAKAIVSATDPSMGVSGRAVAAIINSRLSSLSVTPTSPKLSPGDTRQMVARAVMSDGSKLDFTNSVIWKSSGTNVYLSQDPTTYGRIGGISSGRSSITAYDPQRGVTSSTTVTVVGHETRLPNSTWWPVLEKCRTDFYSLLDSTRPPSDLTGAFAAYNRCVGFGHSRTGIVTPGPKLLQGASTYLCISKTDKHKQTLC
jgi:hypothetical protein